MRRHETSLIACSICILGYLVACTPRASDDFEVLAEEASTARPSNQYAGPQVTTALGAIPPMNPPALGVQFEFRTFPADDLDKRVLAELLAHNPKVRQALPASALGRDSGVLSTNDIQAIGEVVAAVQGISLASTSGSILLFDSMMLAVIPGRVGWSNMNIYVIGVPQRKWVLLAVKEMP